MSEEQQNEHLTKETLVDFLRDNLKITVDAARESDYDRRDRTSVTVSLILDDEIIDKHVTYLPEMRVI